MYPKQVEEVAERIYECIDEDLAAETNKETDYCKPIAIEIINKLMLPKFLNGDDLLMTKEEAISLYAKILTHVTVATLKEKGLVDGIEINNDDEMLFLTDKGKEASKILFDKERQT